MADDRGFTPDPTLKAKYERQIEKVERMKEDFLEELRNAFRDNKGQLAREFLEYKNQNPRGGRAQVGLNWGGEASDITGVERLNDDE